MFKGTSLHHATNDEGMGCDRPPAAAKDPGHTTAYITATVLTISFSPRQEAERRQEINELRVYASARRRVPLLVITQPDMFSSIIDSCVRVQAASWRVQSRGRSANIAEVALPSPVRDLSIDAAN